MTLFESALPPGLIFVPNWLSQDEHDLALSVIDSLPFDDSLSRRVQHYGAKYDYSQAAIQELGSAPKIPPVLNALGVRLFNEGYFSRIPDQVIVNEYVENQGIAAHIDRLTFGDAVATISLLETWPMDFESPSGEKIEVLLEARSLAVMTGKSRSEWTHTIAKRKSDLIGGLRRLRGRRVSLTYRTLPVEQ
jgi:alkylated DNA repair dioxygenase AlkB